MYDVGIRLPRLRNSRPKILVGSLPLLLRLPSVSSLGASQRNFGARLGNKKHTCPSPQLQIYFHQSGKCLTHIVKEHTQHHHGGGPERLWATRNCAQKNTSFRRPTARQTNRQHDSSVLTSAENAHQLSTKSVQRHSIENERQQLLYPIRAINKSTGWISRRQTLNRHAMAAQIFVSLHHCTSIIGESHSNEKSEQRVRGIESSR